jgi:hypothetical protein
MAEKRELMKDKNFRRLLGLFIVLIIAFIIVLNMTGTLSSNRNSTAALVDNTTNTKEQEVLLDEDGNMQITGEATDKAAGM